MELNDWADLATGKSGWIEIERAWLRKTQEMYGVFCSKQHDYGPNNIAVGGLKGLGMRIGDKISRLWELTGLQAIRTGKQKGGAAVKDEGIRDTFMDLGDYGIIGMIVADGEWPGLDADNAWGIHAAMSILAQMIRDRYNLPEERRNALADLVAMLSDQSENDA